MKSDHAFFFSRNCFFQPRIRAWLTADSASAISPSLCRSDGQGGERKRVVGFELGESLAGSHRFVKAVQLLQRARESMQGFRVHGIQGEALIVFRNASSFLLPQTDRDLFGNVPLHVRGPQPLTESINDGWCALWLSRQRIPRAANALCYAATSLQREG